MRWNKKSDLRLVWSEKSGIDTAWIPAIDQDVNGQFIAAARSAVPALVAEVRRLRAALDARPIYTMDISHKDMVLGEDGVYYFAAPFASDYIEGHQVKAVKLTGKAQASIDPDELPDEAGHA
jgi:hypothetical protein